MPRPDARDPAALVLRGAGGADGADRVGVLLRSDAQNSPVPPAEQRPIVIVGHDSLPPLHAEGGRDE
jgi:hypothetical protein